MRLAPIRDDTKRGEAISAIWRQYRNGQITAAQMLEHQNAIMPICEYCRHAPSIARTPDGFICASCYIAYAKDTSDV